jgi:mono/diheme cytochrome c family protein
MKKRMWKRLLCLYAVGFAACILRQPGVGFAQEEQPTAAWGKDLFVMYCASCHGESGKGNGPAATALKTPPADLTQISKKHGGTFPRGMVMQVIDGERPFPAHGSREMPIWGRAFRRERSETEARMRVLTLTTFLESLQEK